MKIEIDTNKDRNTNGSYLIIITSENIGGKDPGKRKFKYYFEEKNEVRAINNAIENHKRMYENPDEFIFELIEKIEIYELGECFGAGSDYDIVKIDHRK